VRVATYTRISTDQEHPPYSLEAQETRLAAYVSSQDGWELTRRYSDRMTGSVLCRRHAMAHHVKGQRSLFEVEEP
jgi:site-specific DNA recombinase